MAMLYPNITQKTDNGTQTQDLSSYLLKNRIVFLSSEINETLANSIISQMIFLHSENPNEDIKMYINSPGGTIVDGLAIYDTMQFVNPDICTFCIGHAASMAAILLAAGTKGKRCAFPHSNIMIHQPCGGATGQTTDMLIRAEYANRLKSETEAILHEHTGIPIESLQKHMDRDYHMTATEAQSLGMIDEIIHKKERK